MSLYVVPEELPSALLKSTKMIASLRPDPHLLYWKDCYLACHAIHILLYIIISPTPIDKTYYMPGSILVIDWLF